MAVSLDRLIVEHRESLVDEITKDVSLMVTDFAEEDEVDEGKMLWENMISNLKQILGST